MHDSEKENGTAGEKSKSAIANIVCDTFWKLRRRMEITKSYNFIIINIAAIIEPNEQWSRQRLLRYFRSLLKRTLATACQAHIW